MRILALTRYGPRAASTRQRFLQYRPAFSKAGIELDIAPFLGDRHVASLSGSPRPSLAYYAEAYLHRAASLIDARRYDVVWIHCELFPYLPGWVEALGTRIAAIPAVFDYDDAIFHMYELRSSAVARALLSRKLEPLLRRVAAATCGNEYLREYASRFCPNSLVVPTVVDTDQYRPASRSSGVPVIGWIGSPSSWVNVRPILPILQEVCATGAASFRAVGAGLEAEADRFPGMELVEWTEAQEVKEVQSFNVGIMPLLDEPFQRGKSGYKLIQYMACGLPAVASPVGVNREIIDNGETGFLAEDPEAWRLALSSLVEDAVLRRRISNVSSTDHSRRSAGLRRGGRVR